MEVKVKVKVQDKVKGVNVKGKVKGVNVKI